jgi:hypothetical protein
MGVEMYDTCRNANEQLREATMKKLILILAFILLASPVWAGDSCQSCKEPVQTALLSVIGGGGKAAAASCTSCGTEVAVGTLNTSDGTTEGFATDKKATQFTLAATTCITAISVWAHGNWSTASVTGEIWSDNGSDYPLQIIGEGIGITVTGSNAILAEDKGTFAAIKTLPAGKYWAVIYKATGAPYISERTQTVHTYHGFMVPVGSRQLVGM